MELNQIQEEMMKHHNGPVIGIVRLRLGDQRTPLKDFIFDQSDAYEVKIGVQVY